MFPNLMSMGANTAATVVLFMMFVRSADEKTRNVITVRGCPSVIIGSMNPDNHSVAPVLVSASPRLSPAPMMKNIPQLTSLTSSHSMMPRMDRNATAVMAMIEGDRAVEFNPSVVLRLGPMIHRVAVRIITNSISQSFESMCSIFFSSSRAISMFKLLVVIFIMYVRSSHVTGKTVMKAVRPYFIQSKKLQSVIWLRKPLATALLADPVMVTMPPRLAL